MPATLYGVPGLVYAPLGGSQYPADVNGRILNVADKDIVGLRAAGCIDEATWLQIQQAHLGGGTPFSTGVTVYTLKATDNKVNYPGALLILTADDDVTLNVPFGLLYPCRFEFIAAGAGTVTPTALPGATINSVDGFVKTAGQYARMEIIGIAQDVYILTGDGSV